MRCQVREDLIKWTGGVIKVTWCDQLICVNGVVGGGGAHGRHYPVGRPAGTHL